VRQCPRRAHSPRGACGASLPFSSAAPCWSLARSRPIGDGRSWFDRETWSSGRWVVMIGRSTVVDRASCRIEHATPGHLSGKDRPTGFPTPAGAAASASPHWLLRRCNRCARRRHRQPAISTTFSMRAYSWPTNTSFKSLSSSGGIASGPRLPSASQRSAAARAAR